MGKIGNRRRRGALHASSAVCCRHRMQRAAPGWVQARHRAGFHVAESSRMLASVLQSLSVALLEPTGRRKDSEVDSKP
jgi:hypothetical protein